MPVENVAMLPHTVLLIDDDPAIHRLLEFYLRNDAWLTHATCPHEGLRVAERELPDLILLDMRMPKLNGFEVCKRLKANWMTAHIPVIYLSSERHRAYAAKGMRLGASGYIHKPVSEAKLKSTIRSTLHAV